MDKKNEDNRKIIHVDMDAFYASVEQRDNPDLRGKPLAVGGSGGRGVIAAASYEARKFGVKSAMPAQVALRKCPKLLFVRPNFDKYKAISYDIRSIFERYTSIIEPLSLDEAFLDVTYSNYGISSATLIAQQIKNDIQNELNLVASAGVSYNKFLAKIASDQDKPNGLFVITPDEGFDFMKQLPIERFFGVGKVTTEKMHDYNIYKGEDLLPYALTELQTMFGKSGSFLYKIARAQDNRPVKSERIRKSIGAEMTFSKDIVSEIEVNEKLTTIFEKWWGRYQSFGVPGKSISVKIRTADFQTFSRSFTKEDYFEDQNTARNCVFGLLKESNFIGEPIRLLGISISGLKTEVKKIKSTQLTISF
ncbi:MAG: DNA polymerase IV [Brumimicrobium sp.]